MAQVDHTLLTCHKGRPDLAPLVLGRRGDEFYAIGADGWLEESLIVGDTDDPRNEILAAD